jgi:hypothetical protein
MNTAKLIGADELLRELFTDASRPSLRWLRKMQSNRSVPFVKLGRRVFFDPEQVRDTLRTRAAGKVKHAA